jgi:hypothetical protein
MISGVYYHIPPKPEKHCADDPDPPSFCSILRFYPDGKVVAATVVSESLEADWPKVGRWLTEAHHSGGSYRILGEAITFTIASKHENKDLGTVEYFGIVQADALLLSWKSSINHAIKNGVPYVRLASENF